MKDLILGSHIYFAREGDVIDGVTVGVGAKPDTDPDTNWTKLGCVQESEVGPPEGDENLEIFCPSPGRYMLDRIINQGGGKMVDRVQLYGFSTLNLIELLRNAEKPQGGVYVPNSRKGPIRGWVKIQRYAQDDSLVIVEDIWCELTTEKYTFKRQYDANVLVITHLYSSLTEGLVQNVDN